jgi:hypothetical protein
MGLLSEPWSYLGHDHILILKINGSYCTRGLSLKRKFIKLILKNELMSNNHYRYDDRMTIVDRPNYKNWNTLHSGLNCR